MEENSPESELFLKKRCKGTKKKRYMQEKCKKNTFFRKKICVCQKKIVPLHDFSRKLG